MLAGCDPWVSGAAGRLRAPAGDKVMLAPACLPGGGEDEQTNSSSWTTTPAAGKQRRKTANIYRGSLRPYLSEMDVKSGECPGFRAPGRYKHGQMV